MPGITFENARPDSQRRDQKHKPGQRTGDPDVEQHALAVDRRANANERAQRAGQRRGRGQKERQRGIHPVIHAGQIVAQFVGHQNGEQRERKRQPGQEKRGLPQPQRENIEVAFHVEKRQIVAEVVLHVRAHQRGRKQRQDEQQQIQPEPFFPGG